MKTVALATLLMHFGGSAGDDGLNCRPFHEIYASGKELCEVMWDHAFAYEEDESSAFTMWWFDEANPNDATNLALGFEPVQECGLEYFHKAGPPTEEGDDFTECHPWKDNACCYESTVTTHDALRAAYGPGYEWDRCGQLSQACERFFVQEACMYECEVNTANYRRCTDDEATTGAILDAGLPTETDCSGNTWQMWKMPIKASYCDAWYTACYNDHFCGHGSYFECAITQTEAPTPETPGAEKKKSTKEELPGAILALLIVLGVFALAISAAVFWMYSRERSGAPLFKPISVTDEVKAQQEMT